MAVVIAMTANIAEAGPAKANTPPDRVSHAWLELTAPSNAARNQYSALINSLRAAAGHVWRDGIMQTQTNRNTLVRLDLNNGVDRLQLWISPDNLYLRGFTNRHGTFTFNDHDYNLYDEIEGLRTTQNAGLLPSQPNPSHRWRTMNFGSNYIQLERAARLGRDHVAISFNEVLGAVRRLAGTTEMTSNNRDAVAQALILMIQYTSEAARFNDVYRVMASIMENRDIRYSGMSPANRQLENSWDSLSGFALRLTNGTNPDPLNVPNVGVLHTFLDVRRYLALAHGDTKHSRRHLTPGGN
jgi:hypothetical protein